MATASPIPALDPDADLEEQAAALADRLGDTLGDMARMKDKDQQWQAAKAQFDDKLADLFALTRDLHDGPSRVASYGSGNLWWQVLGNGPAGWW